MTMDEIREMVAALVQSARTAVRWPGSDADDRSDDARAALLMAVEGIAGERDRAEAALAAMREALEGVKDEATRIDRSHVERVMVIAVTVDAALASPPPAALSTETDPTPTKSKEDPKP